MIAFIGASLKALKKKLLGPAITGSYRGLPIHQFNTVRDLPPFTFRMIHAMLRDPTVRLGLAMRAAPLSQVEFAYPQPGADNKIAWIPGIKADRPEVGMFVEQQLNRIWTFYLHKILIAQVWGWSSGEITYRLKGKKVEVDRILQRNAFDVFALQRNGETVGAQFRRLPEVSGGSADLFFPKCFWHSYFPEDEQPYGVSALIGAYSPWADKWFSGGALDVRRLFMFKDSYGGMDIAYPPGTTDIDGKGEVPNQNIARELAEKYRAGGVTARPQVFDENGNKLWDITRATIPTSPTHILDYPKDLDVEILRGLEIPDDILTSEGGGAWQGKQVPMQAFFTGLDRWLAQVIQMMCVQILEPLVLLNFGPEEFEVRTKPLAQQAMEQMKAIAGATVTGTTGPSPDTVADGIVELPGAGENRRVSLPELTRRARMSTDDQNSAELLVGQGVVEASHLVRAGREFMDRMASGDNGHAS